MLTAVDTILNQLKMPPGMCIYIEWNRRFAPLLKRTPHCTICSRWKCYLSEASNISSRRSRPPIIVLQQTPDRLLEQLQQQKVWKTIHKIQYTRATWKLTTNDLLEEFLVWFLLKRIWYRMLLVCSSHFCQSFGKGILNWIGRFWSAASSNGNLLVSSESENIYLKSDPQCCFFLLRVCQSNSPPAQEYGNGNENSIRLVSILMKNWSVTRSSLKCYGPLAILSLWIYVYPLVEQQQRCKPRFHYRH